MKRSFVINTGAALLPIHSISLPALPTFPPPLHPAGKALQLLNSPVPAWQNPKALASPSPGAPPAPLLEQDICHIGPIAGQAQHGRYLAPRLPPAEHPIDPPLLRPFQNPIPPLQHFCLPSDRRFMRVTHRCGCRSRPKGFVAVPQAALLQAWSSLSRSERDTTTERAPKRDLGRQRGCLPT